MSWGRALFHCLQGTPLPHPVSLLTAGKRCAFKGCPATTSTTSQNLNVCRFVDVEAKVWGLVEDRTAGKVSACLVRVLETAQRGGR